MMNYYQILDVPYNADQRTIKRAYAALIKKYRPDSHPVEFARIRTAYEVLLEQCRYQQDEDSSDTSTETLTDNGSPPVEPLNELVDTSQKIDDWQLDRFSHLVDKPVIQLLEISPQSEDHSDYFSRLIDKPLIQPQQTAELDAIDLLWVKEPAINISALIKQLSDYQQPANEQAALICFQAHKLSFSTMNLDHRMDYEEKLYDSLIYADRPALLVFAAASEYFNWTNSSSWIKATQSKWSKQRFNTLSQLSALYRTVCKSDNPYFQAPHDVAVTPCWLSTHYHHQLAKEQRDEWLRICQTANLTELQTYFADKPACRPLYAIDVLFGVWLGYLVLQNYPLSTWLMPVALSFAGLLWAGLLQIWRALNLNISKNTMWTVVCVAIVFMVQLPKGIGSVLFVVLFCAVLLKILYAWLAKLETMIAKIVERIRYKKPLTQHSIHSKTSLTMNKQIYPLLIAQFLSAFADNAILFTVIAIVMQANSQASWYIPALQSSFLIAYVVLGPWVGGIADRHAKARVLLFANLIKAVGAGLLLLGIEPLLAYGMVGVGAAVYSPAKYGILPELVGHNELVKANSWIEGSTILAILLGMKIGAMVADYSTAMALLGTVVLFIISALATLSLPVNISKKDNEVVALVEFGKQMALFFTTPRSRFAVLGGSLFWAAAASLRVILIAWAPLVLMSKNASEIADLTLYLTVGIIGGSIIVPRLIPLEHLRRARIPAYLMAIFITGLSLTTSVLSAQVVLFAIGIMGGMFIVPINAALQEQGQQTIGSGSAVALQNFFQNLSMLLAVGAYTLAASQQINPMVAMSALGGLVLIATFLVSLHLPDNQ